MFYNVFKLNDVSEDLVALLVRERAMVTEHEELKDKLTKSLSQADVAALSLAVSTGIITYECINLRRYETVTEFFQHLVRSLTFSI